jgi:tRNA/rRNA methyltransferase
MDIPAPVVILDRPQLAENIGAVARVMANFGLTELRIVNPRDGWPQDRAWAAASGADWILDELKVFSTVAEAVADLQTVLATTGRPRGLRMPIVTPREAAADLHKQGSSGLKTGLLFGGERTGLETDELVLCQAIVTIPVDMKHRSLNLAQAVSINAYEWRVTVDAAPPDIFGESDPPAPAAEVERMFGHLEAELENGGFFHPPEKKPTMVRSIRAMLNRVGLSSQEVRMLRGMIVALSKGRGRVLQRRAEEASKD